MIAAGLTTLLLAAANIDTIERLEQRVKLLEDRLNYLQSHMTVAYAVPVATALQPPPQGKRGRRTAVGTAVEVPTLEMVGEHARVSFGQLDAEGTVLMQRVLPNVLALDGTPPSPPPSPPVPAAHLHRTSGARVGTPPTSRPAPTLQVPST